MPCNLHGLTTIECPDIRWFKRLRLLLESTIYKIREEYKMKTIDDISTYAIIQKNNLAPDVRKKLPKLSILK